MRKSGRTDLKADGRHLVVVMFCVDDRRRRGIQGDLRRWRSDVGTGQNQDNEEQITGAIGA